MPSKFLAPSVSAAAAIPFPIQLFTVMVFLYFMSRLEADHSPGSSTEEVQTLAVD